MSTSSSSRSGGMGFLSILTLIFITLKLTDNIDWSWWWILSQAWISLSIVALVLIVGVIAFVWKNAK